MSKTTAYVAPRQYHDAAAGRIHPAMVMAPSIRDRFTRDAVIALACGEHDDTDPGVTAAYDRLFTDGADPRRLAGIVVALTDADRRDPTPYNLEALAALAWLDSEPQVCVELLTTIAHRHGLQALLQSQTAGILLRAVAQGTPAPGAGASVIAEAERLLES